MYPDIITNYLKKADEFVINNHRALYYDFFKFVEEFSAKNDIVIGGPVAMFLHGVEDKENKKLPKDIFQYDLYTDDLFNKARKITDGITQLKFKHVDPKMVELQTNIKNKELTIYVNTFALFKLYSLDNYKGSRLFKIMEPHAGIGFFSPRVLLMPLNLILVEICHSIYLPNRLANIIQNISFFDILTATKNKATTGANDRAEEEEDEEVELRENIENSDLTWSGEVENIRANGVEGGAEAPYGKKARSDKLSPDEIVEMIVDNFVISKDVIVIGDYAHEQKDKYQKR